MVEMKPCLLKVRDSLRLMVYSLKSLSIIESGNMIIMALSYAQRTGDNSHLTQYV